jgi:outer membrane murein-binding lipoprotein Lpp
LAAVLFLPQGGLCYEPAPPLTDREIIERLNRLEEGQKALRNEIQVHFESIDKRFESIDKRFESIDKRFDQLIGLLTAVVAAFAGIVAVTIGFAIWDRRTAVRPLEAQIKLLENEKVNKIRAALQAYAEKNPEWATVMRNFGLL